ncbi:hypothetical protein GYMLUDRAFT_581287 [Collybiopsis luxurians FD-317 M1]|uniref:Uncharacterized protein n=1 Tax=Collybiopsis luxurians FD-317 M1 TaxID=944289 RepID=A0A0D0BZM0_9AGAR|nr:hypothetical protein GYMLUDRAFT_581287 [Collybiopsis luxurians FD-317 M1]
MANFQSCASASGSGPSFGPFQSAHHFQMIQPSFTNVGRDQIVHYSPRIPGEQVYIIRKFDREEDRDSFHNRLQRSSWAPFSMQPLWKLNINGSPCLAVSSAPVYTLQEMTGGPVYSKEIRKNMYLKVAKFFLENDKVYPGHWNSAQLYDGRGKYRNLRLFDESGIFTINPEELKSLGLIYEEFDEFKKLGDKKFSEQVRQYWEKHNMEGKKELNYEAMMHIKAKVKLIMARESLQ